MGAHADWKSIESQVLDWTQSKVAQTRTTKLWRAMRQVNLGKLAKTYAPRKSCICKGWAKLDGELLQVEHNGSDTTKVCIINYAAANQGETRQIRNITAERFNRMRANLHILEMHLVEQESTI